MPKQRTVDGFLISNAKKVCKRIFEAFYISVRINEDLVFEIKLKETLKVRQIDGSIKTESIHDYIDVDNFKKKWHPFWIIMYDKSEQA